MITTSIIVITKNNITTIKKCIESLNKLNFNKDEYEIIFVDGHSNDGTDEYIKKHATQNTKIIYEEKGSMGYARNLGIKETKGSYIFFLDADAYPEEDWLKKILKHFQDDSKVIVVGGMDHLVGGSKTRVAMDSWRRLGKSFGVHAIPKIKTVNFAIRRDVLVKYGVFDESLSHFDEGELMARLYDKDHTFGFIFDPDIAVYHERSNSSYFKGYKKVFKKTVIGVPVLLKTYMGEVALRNISSPLGVSYLLMIWGAALPFILIFTLLLCKYLNLLFILSLSALIIIIVSYTTIVWLKTRRIYANLILILLFDIILRSIGSSYGFYKHIFKSIFKINSVT